MLAGMALIAILLLLRMTVASGTVNGMILYVNVVHISKDLFFPPEMSGTTLLTVFIAWTNLNFGIPTCLYDGLDHYTYTWLQFLFPFY